MIFDETSVSIIPQLRQLLDVYASPYAHGELVFPDIFFSMPLQMGRKQSAFTTSTTEFQRISRRVESHDIQCVTPQRARNFFILAVAHHGVMTAYIDYAVGHATSEVSPLLAGCISNVTPAMMQAFNYGIFIGPPI